MLTWYEDDTRHLNGSQSSVTIAYCTYLLVPRNQVSMHDGKHAIFTSLEGGTVMLQTSLLESGSGTQIEMWERITAGLASLGDQAVAGDSRESLPSEQNMDEQQLVEYEGMLVAASAAQRRRCPHTIMPMLEYSAAMTFQSASAYAQCFLERLIEICCTMTMGVSHELGCGQLKMTRLV